MGEALLCGGLPGCLMDNLDFPCSKYPHDARKTQWLSRLYHGSISYIQADEPELIGQSMHMIHCGVFSKCLSLPVTVSNMYVQKRWCRMVST